MNQNKKLTVYILLLLTTMPCMLLSGIDISSRRTVNKKKSNAYDPLLHTLFTIVARHTGSTIKKPISKNLSMAQHFLHDVLKTEKLTLKENSADTAPHKKKSITLSQNQKTKLDLLLSQKRYNAFDNFIHTCFKTNT